jgi:hypothetical protein
MLDRLFLPVKPFQPILIFESKDKAYLSLPCKVYAHRAHPIVKLW